MLPNEKGLIESIFDSTYLYLNVNNKKSRFFLEKNYDQFFMGNICQFYVVFKTAWSSYFLRHKGIQKA